MTITFKVNLLNPDYLSAPLPFTQSTWTVQDLATTKLSYFPNHLLNNRELKHGVEFTATDHEAYYLKENFTSGPFKFLDIVSQS